MPERPPSTVCSRPRRNAGPASANLLARAKQLRLPPAGPAQVEQYAKNAHRLRNRALVMEEHKPK
jgi:hypothetical protein